MRDLALASVDSWAAQEAAPAAAQPALHELASRVGRPALARRLRQRRQQKEEARPAAPAPADSGGRGDEGQSDGAPEVEAPIGGLRNDAQTGFNIRSGPGTSFGVVAGLAPGHTCYLLAADEAAQAAGWHRVRYGEQTGYISASLTGLQQIQASEVTPPPPPAPPPPPGEMPADPATGWGRVLGTVHGVEVRKNHVPADQLATLKQNLPDIAILDGDIYYTSYSSTYGYAYQCVELVKRYYAQALGVGGLGSGNAKSFLDGERAGLQTHALPGPTRPQPGDLMVRTSGTYGHVAIVSVAGDSNIEIAQQNVPDSSAFASRSMTVTDTAEGKQYAVDGFDGFRRKAGATVPDGATTSAAAPGGGASQGEGDAGTAAQVGSTVRILASPYLRVRSEASTAGAELGRLDTGATAVVRDVSGRPWLQIDFQGQPGFIRGDFATVITP